MSETHLALTNFAEDETAFRHAVREFGEGEIRPLVSKMDSDAAMDKGLIKKFFEMGIMAIETPEAFGGAGSSHRSRAIGYVGAPPKRAPKPGRY